MIKSNSTSATQNDIKNLAQDANNMLSEAASQASAKAQELREKGVGLLDDARASAQELQRTTLAKGREALHTTDDYVHQNPWRAVTVSAAIGLLAGFIFSRR